MSFLFSAGDASSTAPAVPDRVGGPKTAASGVAAPSRFWVYAGIYASGVIFGLIIGKLYYARSARAAPQQTGLETLRDYGANRDKTQWIDPTSELPRGQRKKIGETVSLSQLDVTGLGVERRKIALVRIDPFSRAQQRSDSRDECLVLRVRFRNTAKDVAFAPLDEMFLRPHDPTQYPTYSFIELDDGQQIAMYELAEFSEHNIEGQPFDAIKPGEELEAIVPACEGSPSQARGTMLWRLQVRGGARRDERTGAVTGYGTVVGFEFTPDQVKGG